MKNITKKQMITLIVLICILFLVIAVQYFYRPVLDKKSELADKVETMQMVYDDMKMMQALYSIDATSYAEEKEALAKKRQDFLPLMTASQQDDMLTRMLVDGKMAIGSSKIAELHTDTVRVECAADTANDNDGEGYSSVSMYPVGGRLLSDEYGSAVLQYNTGEYSREIYYNVTGKYEDIINFLRKIYQQPSMEVSSFYFNSGDLESVITYEEPAEEENSGEENSEDESDEVANLSDLNTVKTDKIISNSVYKAGIGIRVHMYDREFDLVSSED